MGFGDCGTNKCQRILPQHGGVEPTSAIYSDGATRSRELSAPIRFDTGIVAQNEEWHDGKTCLALARLST